MARICLFIFALSVLITTVSFAQIDTISVPAGSPEDVDLNIISKEPDAQKKISMYQEYLQKYSSNQMAVAFANWQLSQAYDGIGESQKAIEAGDKALALSPRNLDILTSQILIAQKLQDNAKVFDYSIRGGTDYNSIDKQTKPAGVSDEQFHSDIAADKAQNKSAYQFFQSVAFNVLGNENDPNKRMDYIDKFTAAFPKSGLDDQITSYAMMALSELKDNKRLIAYGEKALEANPENLSALILLASTYVDSPAPGSTTKAIAYAKRAVSAAKADSPSADKSSKISAGLGHCLIGRALAKEDKTLPSIEELKSATVLLKGEDDQQFAVAAYFLGWDYAKLNKLSEAQAALNDAAAISGPIQAPAKELLAKVNSARGKKK